MRLLPLLLTLACAADKAVIDTAQPDTDSGTDTDTDSGTDTDTDTDSGTDTDTDTDTDTAEPLSVEDVLREALARDIRRNEASGASVAVWMDGEIIAFGYGDRHPDLGGAVDTDTLFQIGSDTKKLTALAVLQQVSAGTVSLDDTLSTALPDLRFASDESMSDQITVAMLMSHQSGIYDYTPWDDAPSDDELADRAYGEFADNEWMMGAPGLFWNYANPGFSTLGLVAEEAAGRPYVDILNEDLFVPLGMNRSFGRLSEVAADGNYATGTGIGFIEGAARWDIWSEEFDYTYGTVEMEDQVDNGFTRPAGLVWSTATDMVKLAQFLVDGDDAVLDTELLRELETAAVPLYPTVPGQSYGYGLMILDGFNLGSNYYATPLWIHGGNTLTQTSTFYVLPDQRFAISILSNGYADSWDNTMAAALELADLGEPSDGPSAPEPEDLASYQGTWVDHLLGEITLTYDGTDLNISIPTMDALGYTVRPALSPIVKDVFYVYLDGAAYDITFIDGPDGTPHQYLRNRSFVGVLDGDMSAVRPAPPTAAEVGSLLVRANVDDPLRSARFLLPGPLGDGARAAMNAESGGRGSAGR